MKTIEKASRLLLCAGLLAMTCPPVCSAIKAQTDGAGTRSRIRIEKNDWWKEDVWSNPERPFLYYGDPDREKNKSKAESTLPRTEKSPTDPRKEEEKVSDTTLGDLSRDDFSRFTTIESLREERERRLSAAIMSPTQENMASYQAVNAHMLTLAARFASAWQLGRLMSPEYDWTSEHPSANFASLEDKRIAKEKRNALIAGLGRDAGLLFIGDPDDPMTAVAAGPIEAFARLRGIEILAVAAGRNFPEPLPGSALPGFKAFERVFPEKGETAFRRSLGITRLPALLLIPSPEAMKGRSDFFRLKGALRGHDGFPIASGPVSGEEIARRIELILSADFLKEKPIGQSEDPVMQSQDGLLQDFNFQNISFAK